VAAATTDKVGKVSFTTKATTTGTWRITFAGNAGYAAAVSGTDAVKVAKAAAISPATPAPTPAPPKG
jgi:hypothetical protein